MGNKLSVGWAARAEPPPLHHHCRSLSTLSYAEGLKKTNAGVKCGNLASGVLLGAAITSRGGQFLAGDPSAVVRVDRRRREDCCIRPLESRQ